VSFSGDGPWALPIAGFEVLTLTFAPHGVDVIAYGPDGISTVIRLSGPFEYRDAEGAARTLDPETQSWADLGVLFALRRDHIELATATQDSRLRVEFASGRVLASGADGAYENWEVSGPGNMLIVGTPGEATVWDGEAG